MKDGIDFLHAIGDVKRSLAMTYPKCRERQFVEDKLDEAELWYTRMRKHYPVYEQEER